jgi:hypothetical protein
MSNMVFAVRSFAVRGSIEKSSKYIQIKCGFQFGLVQFAILFLDWFRYDHP